MKPILRPLIGALLIVILFMGMLIVSLGRLNKIKSTINANKKIETSLLTKLNILETVDEKIGENITLIDVVLPSRGGVLYALNQIKTQSSSYGLTVSALSSSGEVSLDAGITKNSISFDLDGEILNIYAFLQSISRSLPIMRIIDIDLKTNSVVAKASVSLDVYSARLPKNIPSVDGQINSLTDKELNILDELIKYKPPQFVEPKPSNPSERSNPFSSI